LTTTSIRDSIYPIGAPTNVQRTVGAPTGAQRSSTFFYLRDWA